MMALFDDIGAVFDASVNWPKRLAHEEPFYRRLFAQHGVSSVLDAACGPGHHAAMFHRWGMRVQGADLSATMIERARAHHGEGSGLEWAVRGYETPAPAAFDAVICVGNSLALAPDRASARRAVVSMMAAAQKLVVIHLANMWAWPEGECLWQKCLRAVLPQGPATIVKGVHRSADRPFIELLVISGEEVPTMSTESVELLGLEAAELEDMLRNGGASRVAMRGGYREEEYKRATSVDLIAVATKSSAP
ncbi:MAG TPA: class I SAM-dependent methyltransferase [Phycisphaerae bacterium]|nr:class I SAM-dependent methyltransferase [Phycisphaerae bacterium]